jgi:hypothetical protein
MRIQDSQVTLASARAATTLDQTRSTMEAWVGARPQRAAVTRIGDRPASIVALSTQAIAAASRQAAAKQATAAVAQQVRSSLADIAAKAQQTVGAGGTDSDASDPAVTDPNLVAFIALIEKLTGKKVHLIHPHEADGQASAAQSAPQSAGGGAPAQAQQAEGWGVEVHIEQVHQETESTAFSAEGKVVTGDGKTITFAYELAMQRTESIKVTTDILAGDAARKIDPIALNLNGGPVALSENRTSFDLNSDGTDEKIATPADGTYFLTIDTNENGKVDNGAELFGPATGNGFTELKKLDTDANGWIDEADKAYSSLRLWSGSGNDTKSLAEAGIGALFVGQSASTQFELKSGSNESLGQIVTSSVYLRENGTAGALQQVDLTA